MEFGETSHPFDSPDWAFELKYDGYRVLASTGPGARLKTRAALNATGWVAEVARSLEQLPGECVVDGEVAVLDDLGRSDFELLRDRARARGWREGLPLVC